MPRGLLIFILIAASLSAFAKEEAIELEPIIVEKESGSYQASTFKAGDIDALPIKSSIISPGPICARETASASSRTCPYAVLSLRIIRS